MAMSLPFVDRSSSSLPLQFVSQSKWVGWLKAQSAARRGWIESLGIAGAPGDLVTLPGGDGKAAGAVLVISDKPTLWDFGALATRLPPGTWRFADDTSPVSPTDAAVAIGLGAWRFDRYRSKKGKAGPRLLWPQGADKARATAIIEAVSLARDLITTPSSDMGPAELAAAVQKVGKAHKATVKVIVGDALLKQNYPMVHAVGRASTRAPRLIDLTWGRARDPKVTLVGKGVCFDTGGYDIKPSSNMLRMKKDMGGAAVTLGLAHLVMRAKLPVRLVARIGCVENSISGRAMRPLDVLRTRRGLQIEVGNTDAEGRLVLADLLAEASDENPAMLFDFATLTGAARAALGPELPALFANDDALADALVQAGQASGDPLWRLPLWDGYDSWLKSPVADLQSVSGKPFAGAVVAALFLRRFVRPGTPWAHIDAYCWNDTSRPGHPEGGEAQALRASFAAIRNRFGALPETETLK